MIHIVQASHQPPQPWRNGGGCTRELLCWPDARKWTVRVSVADVDRDGPFSAFAGVLRWFVVVSGAGVVLDRAQGPLALPCGHPPHRFDGAEAPGCRLIDGPTTDLNLMLRGEGRMAAVQPGVPWRTRSRWRGLFTAVAGQWVADAETRSLPAGSLLWGDGAAPAHWRFEPEASGPGGHAPATAWWLAGGDPA